MTTSTTHDAFVGGIGHLRLHTPTRPCPFEHSTAKNLANFDQLSLAFEQATGWQLGYRETMESRQKRQAAKDPALPIAGQMSIQDLSQLIPPGIPAAGRIYCEKLVDEMNQLLDELDQCRQELFDLRQKSSDACRPEIRAGNQNDSGLKLRVDLSPTASTKSTKSASSPPIELPPCNLPLTSHSVNIVPLLDTDQNALFEWYVEPTGKTRFAAMVCERSATGNATSELTAARATFLTECRHRSCDETINYEIQSVIERLFPGDSIVHTINGSVDSLTGDLTLAGCKEFLLSGTSVIDGLTEVPDAELLRTYLPSSQHLVITRWPDLRCDLTHQWLKGSVKKMTSIEPLALPSVFNHQLQNAIPRLPNGPQIALSITRV